MLTPPSNLLERRRRTSGAPDAESRIAPRPHVRSTRSRPRWRWHLALPRLALPRAGRRVGLPHQAVRLVFLRGLCRSLGGLRLGRWESHRLRSSLNYTRRLRGTLRQELAQRLQRRIALLVRHRFDAALVLELHLLRHQHARLW